MMLLGKSYWTVKNTPRKGRGMFASQDIDPGTVIGDYRGKIIHPDEEDEATQNGFYAMCWHENIAFLPVDLKAEDIHLINHSCAPNLCMYPYHGHMLYVALRKIFAGEEFLVSYMVSPSAESTHTYPCYCGESFCQGTMFCNPAQADDFWDKLVETTFKPHLTSIPPHGQHLPPLSSYPTTLPDHRVYDLYGNTKLPALVLQNQKLPGISALRKQIRQTGLTLSFPKLKIIVLGVTYPKHLLISPLLN